MIIMKKLDNQSHIEIYGSDTNRPPKGKTITNCLKIMLIITIIYFQK